MTKNGLTMIQYKFVNIDFMMIVLNATSLGVLTLNWFSEHLNTAGGFIVMLSVAALNFAKAYKNIKDAKNGNTD